MPRLALKNRGTVGHLLPTVVYVMVKQCLLTAAPPPPPPPPPRRPDMGAEWAQLASRHAPKRSKGVIRNGGHVCLAASPQDGC